MAILGVACSKPGVRPPEAPVHYLPAEVFDYHVDSRFTPQERRWLSKAAGNLQEQTRGLVVINLTFDLDVLGPATEAPKEVIVRMTSEDDPVVKWDATHPQSALLGLTHLAEDATEPLVIFLVVDRLQPADRFTSVAMHEMLHAAGLGHTEDPRSVMAATAGPNPTCLHRADVAELCSHLFCDVDRVGYCH